MEKHVVRDDIGRVELGAGTLRDLKIILLKYRFSSPKTTIHGRTPLFQPNIRTDETKLRCSHQTRGTGAVATLWPPMTLMIISMVNATCL